MRVEHAYNTCAHFARTCARFGEHLEEKNVNKWLTVFESAVKFNVCVCVFDGDTENKLSHKQRAFVATRMNGICVFFVCVRY